MSATFPVSETGIRALVEAQRPQLDRLPAVQHFAGQLASALTRRFRQLAGEDAELRVAAIRQRDLSDGLAAIGSEATLARFECLPQAGAGVVSIDNRLLRPLLDLALGGGSAVGTASITARPATAIETRLIERLMRQVLAEMVSTIRSLAPLEFRFDRLESRPPPADNTVSPATVLMISLEGVVRGVEGGIEIILPSVVVDRLRAVPPGAADTGAQEPGAWAGRLLAGALAAEVELEAILHEGMVGLAFAGDLKPGRTVPFELRPETTIAVRCGGVGIATATIACREDRLVLSVERTRIDIEASR